ncbi:MAG: adenylate/guanylate cyclase domain-containing protein, partial [bacterium]|nr:adenylate/guanylate cyclase domain-containing protein [bacterium]
MKKFIPQFIYERYLLREYHGVFRAGSMFFDIPGFTGLTEVLMKNGKEGAENLSEIIDKIFIPIINIISKRSGFITTFAGDGATVIFPGKEGISSSLLASNEIIEYFKKNKLFSTKFGKFPISIKIGLSSGNVSWGILGIEDHKEFYFKGNAVEGCARSEQKCEKMEVIFDNNVLKEVKDFVKTEKIGNGYFKLKEIILKEKEVEEIKTVSLNKKIISKFIPDTVINYTQKGEFRDIVSVFVKFKDPGTFKKLNMYINEIIVKARKYGGYLNHIDFGDKGSNLLVFFGAPISYEDNILRASNFAKEILNMETSIGMTEGTVYSGIIGNERRCVYTCLGDVVNLSSRIVMKTIPGEIWIPESLSLKIKDNFETSSVGKIEFKGVSKPLSIFKLGEAHNIKNDDFFSGEMFGRIKELKFLNKFIKPIFKNKFSGITYVYGDAGIGKSRLIHEFTENLKPGIETCLMQCDGILKKSLNPFIYFLNDFFKTINAKTNEDKLKLFEDVFNNFLSGLKNISATEKEFFINELERTKSIIGSLIGLTWKDSLYEQLESKSRFNSTIFTL